MTNHYGQFQLYCLNVKISTFAGQSPMMDKKRISVNAETVQQKELRAQVH